MGPVLPLPIAWLDVLSSPDLWALRLFLVLVLEPLTLGKDEGGALPRTCARQRFHVSEQSGNSRTQKEGEEIERWNQPVLS